MRKLVLTSLLALSLAAGARAADSYSFDKDHTTIGFSVKHLTVSSVHGQFKDYAGTIMYDPKDVTKSSVKVSIKTASIDTANEKRDNHLRTGDFFDAPKFPEITFVSKKIEKKADGYVASGTLTIKGVSKEVSFPFTLNGPVDAFGGTHLGAEGALTINRQDYGVSFNAKLDNGGLLVGDDVKIELSIDAAKDKKK